MGQSITSYGMSDGTVRWMWKCSCGTEHRGNRSRATAAVGALRHQRKRHPDPK